MVSVSQNTTPVEPKRVSFSDVAGLGAAIASTRRKQNLTQLDLAEFAGVGITFINQLEKGKGGVRLDLVLKVLAALNIKPVLILPEYGDD